MKTTSCLVLVVSLVTAQLFPAALGEGMPATPVTAPIAFSNLIDSPIVSLELETAPFVDNEKKTFAIFRPAGQFEVPLYIGKIEWKEGREQWIATRKITSSGNLYFVTDPRDEAYLQVMERLPEGGFGRLLRHRDTGIDLEFVYSDKEGEVTILDYTSGRYYQVTYQEKREVPVSVAASEEAKQSQTQLTATVVTSPKSVGVSGFVTVPEKKKSPTESLVDNLVQERLRNRRHLRGPPVWEYAA